MVMRTPRRTAQSDTRLSSIDKNAPMGNTKTSFINTNDIKTNDYCGWN